MDAAARLERLTRNTQEVVTDQELSALSEALSDGQARTAYIGFEPSGRVHLGWKICADKVTDLIDAGLDVTILLADWHAQINDKLDGDLEKIRACGQYMKQCFAALGVPIDRVTFRYASDYVGSAQYWSTVLDVAKHTTLKRMKRAMDIMGRSADEADGDMSKFVYPAMQVADIFHLDFDLAYGGMDQRHAHMLCRDIAKKTGRKPPVALHTPLLPSLKAQGRMDPVESKMSKSDPTSGVLIHDTPQEVQAKLNKAVCPQGQAEGNPVLDMARMIVFAGHLKRGRDEDFVVERADKFGGNASFANYAALEEAFVAAKVHPADLKTTVAHYINQVLAPVHAHFQAHPETLKQIRQILDTA